MLDIFYTRVKYIGRQYIAPNTNIVNDRIRTYLYDVMTYFTTSNIRVRSEHILYRLLTTLSINSNWSNNDIMYYVDTNIRNVLRPLKISSDINMEVIAKNGNIVKNAIEIIYSTSDYTTLELLKINGSNWNDLEPLKFINHNFRDMYFNHPTRLDTIKGDIIIYTLDIKAICIMYKYYVKQQELVGEFSSIGEFIAKYVLTNSLISMADIVLLNNYLDKGGVYINNRQTIGATSVLVFHNLLDKVIDESLIRRSKDRLHILEVLHNIKLLHSNGYDRLILPRNFYETIKSKVFVVLTLLDYINHLTNYLKTNKDGNDQFYTRLGYYLKTLSNLNIATDKSIDNKFDITIDDLRSKL